MKKRQSASIGALGFRVVLALVSVSAILSAPRHLNAQTPTLSCVEDRWTATSLTNVPSGRTGHTGVWTGDEMIIWGGQGYGPGGVPIYLNTGGRYSPGTDSWAATSTTNAPSARIEHSAIWTGSEMIIWGEPTTSSSPGGRYNPATDSWTAASTTNAPASRGGHGAVWTGSEMIVWGGAGPRAGGNYVYENTGGRYNPSTDSWTPTSTTDAPTGRDSHVTVWTGSEMIVWGGTNNTTFMTNTGGRYDPATDSWTATSSVNAPNARVAHTAVWTGSEMIVWGGSSNGAYQDSGGRYDPITDSWTATSSANAPAARGYHMAVWTGREMIVWGGNEESGALSNTGARYNPNTDSWTPMSATDAPMPRSDPSTVWTGGEMILWGGNRSDVPGRVASIPDLPSYVNSGGKYCAQAPSPTPVPSTPTPTPGTPTPNPATPTPSPTPTATPTTQAINLSTRMRVLTGDDVGIGGFIITGSVPKHLLLRAIGPSLTGVPGALADPVLELHRQGSATITSDNWRDDPAQEAAILATGIAPTNNLEAAIDTTLNPGAYTAIARGRNNTTGIALVEVYDLSPAVPAKLANISTRAFVGTGNDIVIAGFILGGNSGNDRIVLRGIGPSLVTLGNRLQNPTLELRDSNGALIRANNNWQDDPTQAAELTAAGLAPPGDLESGIVATLPPGLYTALLAGFNNTIGAGLVEVYVVGP